MRPYVASGGVRAELEWIWRTKPCLQPSRKCGFKYFNTETKEAGGYWYVEGLTLLVMTRGQSYPKWINKRFPPRRIRNDRLTLKKLVELGYNPKKRDINRIRKEQTIPLPTSAKSPTLTFAGTDTNRL